MVIHSIEIPSFIPYLASLISTVVTCTVITLNLSLLVHSTLIRYYIRNIPSLIRKYQSLITGTNKLSSVEIQLLSCADHV